MNPGLMKHPIRIERRSTVPDELGQPVASWTRVGGCFARRMTERARPEEKVADRPTEIRSIVFRVRTLPFIGWYREGDRLVEPARNGLPETVWAIGGWAEVEGSGGMYVDIKASTPAERGE
jgi:hypothetical protein